MMNQLLDAYEKKSKEEGKERRNGVPGIKWMLRFDHVLLIACNILMGVDNDNDNL